MWKKIIIKFYFYCTKIRALLRTSLMFLWELKNAIISQNLRGLCDIKTNTKNPHTVASTSSATYYFITRCLSLSKARSYSSLWFRLRSITVLFITTLGAWACRRHIISIALKSVYSIEHLWCSFGSSKTVSFHKISVDFVILKQIQKIHTQWLRQAQPPIISLHGAWACRRHVLIPPCDFDSAQSPYYLLLHSVPEPVEGTLFLLH